MEWFTIPEHQGCARSKVWGHITKAWKRMVKTLIQLPPRGFYGVLNSSIWWSHDIHLLGYDFTHARAKELFENGLRVVDDIWDVRMSNFILWFKAKDKFNLKDNEEDAWDVITASFMNEWHNILE